MTEEYCYLTVSEAIHDYKQGFLTTTGLVYFYLKISGHAENDDAAEIAKKLGISKSSYYKAVKVIQAYRNNGEL